MQTLSDGQVYTSTYGYDNVYRLTGERRDGPSAYGYTYTYDGMGNRQTLAIEGDGRTTYSYDLDANNQLDWEWSGDTTSTYGYDTRGNTLTKTVSGGGGVTTYTYNDMNKVTKIEYPNSTSSVYAYNGEGTRVKKVNTDGTETYFSYDGANAVMEYDSNGDATAKYWHGPDGLVWMNKSATNMYVGCDHLGSVWNTVTLDAAETIKATYTYTAFGNTTASEVIPNNYRYVGKLGYYNDPESGMMLLGHRYYNPSVGRFHTLDPIKDGENWYGYVENRPTRYADPTGLMCPACEAKYNACVAGVLARAALGAFRAYGWSDIGMAVLACAVGCLIGLGWTAVFGGGPLAACVAGCGIAMLAATVISLLRLFLEQRRWEMQKCIDIRNNCHHDDPCEW